MHLGGFAQTMDVSRRFFGKDQLGHEIGEGGQRRRSKYKRGGLMGGTQQMPSDVVSERPKYMNEETRAMRNKLKKKLQGDKTMVSSRLSHSGVIPKSKTGRSKD